MIIIMIIVMFCDSTQSRIHVLLFYVYFYFYSFNQSAYRDFDFKISKKTEFFTQKHTFFYFCLSGPSENKLQTSQKQ